MLSNKAQHTWGQKKLQAVSHTEEVDGITVYAVKNKLANLKKNGSALVADQVPERIAVIQNLFD